jgi:CheY-like chemotaxis protein
VLYSAQIVKPSLKLRAYAYALDIDRGRRDLLLDHADRFVAALAGNTNIELVAGAIVDQSRSGKEAKFLCHSVDDVLRRQFGSPYRARAVIFASLWDTCAELIGNQSATPAPQPHILEPQNEQISRHSAHRPKILLIFGDPELRELLAETIRKFPSEVTPAADGFEALTEMNRIDFDVIVCEFFLPTLDGDALYAESKPHIRGRFIFLTGQSTKPDPRISSFRQETNAPLVTLPCSAATLTAAISTCLGRRSAARENNIRSGFDSAKRAVTADQLCNCIAAKVVSDLQAMTDLLFGDETGLTNLWEEICVQRQGEESVAWEVYEQTTNALIEAHLEDLPEHDLKAIWLETDHGIDWQIEKGGEPSLSEHSIVEYIAVDYIYARADKFSNARIVEFLSAQESAE